MKEELIKYLSGRYITDVCSLWAETKNYYNDKSIPCGGGYASIDDKISIVLNISEEMIRFKVSLDEIKI